MNPLTFDFSIGRQKPENIRDTAAACPFCARDQLTQILDTKGSMIWLMNKYPVYEHTWPTVIIETDDCHGEFSRYDTLEAARVLDFSMQHWLETIASKRFQSVLFFKNYGPMSGGSLRHPHSQIIGLETHNYRDYIKPAHFAGYRVHQEHGLEVTLSTEPLIGFFEFNIVLKRNCDCLALARNLQGILRYILADFTKYPASYNYYFYDLDDEFLYVKVVPRYVTSPIFVGYGIPQTCDRDRAQEVIHGLRRYLSIHP